ncbi:hypothetical protein RPMA_10910 [Tardiphaga alba]|uniref:Uncharacterized protein n=1 Tax=Tardiphaga alba TaxID=340268 RepID=A0ABX8A9E2_9BRAD|nr:hypothetical protein [Tardiphaga alba]QUS39289.1 hypothetical protein RPMA_10910 [Tardiphaga alba]
MKARSWLAAVWAAALVFPVLLTLGLVPVLKSWQPTVPAQIDVASRASNCRTETIKQLGIEKPNFDLLGQISWHCYTQVRGEAILVDFNIRRLALVNQQIDGAVILWMVVAITISGIALAALQLLAAFRLASGGKGELAQSQELTLEQNKISVKSSVTGLMIFAMSFAFFMVYVAWVYTSKELKQEAPSEQSDTQRANAKTPLPFLGLGGTAVTPPAKPTEDPTPGATPTK